MNRKTPLYIIISKLLRAQRGHSRPYMEAIGLSPGQPKLLNHLAQHGPCLQKDLAAALDVEPGTISKHLTALEENGCIARSGIAGDRRAVCISLTEEGLRRQQLFAAYMKQITGQILKDFTPEEQDAFEELLCRAYYNLSGKEIV